MSATDWFDVVGETYRNSPSASFIGSFPITKKFIATAEMEETRSPRVYHASHQLIGTLNHLISPLVQLEQISFDILNALWRHYVGFDRIKRRIKREIVKNPAILSFIWRIKSIIRDQVQIWGVVYSS